MYFRRMSVAGACALAMCAGAFAAFAAEETKGGKDGGVMPPIATIGDKEVIMKDEFDRAVAALEQSRMAMMRQSGKPAPGPDMTHLDHDQKLRVLDSLVDTRIVHMMAQEAGIKVSDDTVNAEVEKNKTKLPSGTDYATFLQQRGLTEKEVFDRTKQRLEIKAFEEQKTKDVSVTDEEVKAQFDKLKERGVMDDFDVQHILIKAPQGDQAAIAEARKKIDAVHERLKKGEDFAAVAKEVSEDTGSKDKSGEYKGVHRGQMVPEFDKRMAEAKIGEISEPFASQYGWHILKVNRHGTGELTPEIGERIKNQTLMVKQKAEMRKLVQEKRGTLNITINLPAEAPGGAAAPSGEAAPKGINLPVNAAS